MTIETSIARDAPVGGRPSLLRRLLNRQALIMSLLDQAMVSGFGFLVGIATARVIGISEFGRFSLALAFAAFIQVLHDALFAAPMMSFAGRRPKRSGGYYSAVMLMAGVLAVGGGVVVAAGLVVLFALRDGEFLWGFAVAAGLLTAAQCVQLTVRRVSFAQSSGVGASIMDLSRGIIFAVLLIYNHAIDAITIIGMLAVSSALATMAIGAKLRLGPLTRRILRVTAGMHWPVARWLVAAPVANIIQDVIIWVSTGILFGDHAVGGLRAGQYLFGPILVLAMAMENLIPLQATAAWTAGGVSKLRRYLLRIAVPLGLANAVFLIGFVVPAGFWLNLVFGPAYADYAGIARIIGIGVAISLIRNHMVLYFRAVQDTRFVFGAAAFGVVATMATLVPASHVYGLLGVAIALVAGQSASLAVLAAAAVRHYRKARGRGTAARSGPER